MHLEKVRVDDAEKGTISELWAVVEYCDRGWRPVVNKDGTFSFWRTKKAALQWAAENNCDVVEFGGK